MKEIKSKYQKKNYEEISYYFSEFGCAHCGKWFMIDYNHLPMKELPDQSDLFYQITCPYCGKITLEHP